MDAFYRGSTTSDSATSEHGPIDVLYDYHSMRRIVTVRNPPVDSSLTIDHVISIIVIHNDDWKKRLLRHVPSVLLSANPVKPVRWSFFQSDGAGVLRKAW